MSNKFTKKSDVGLKPGEVRYTASGEKVQYIGYDNYTKRHELIIAGTTYRYIADSINNMLLLKEKP